MRVPDSSTNLFEEFISPFTTFTPDSKILDVGCLDSCFLSYLKESEKKKQSKLFQSYLGLDLEEESMNKCRKDKLDPRGDFQVGDITKSLDFDQKSFDIVFCIGTLCHIKFEDLKFTLKQLLSLSKKQLIIDFHHFQDQREPRKVCPKTSDLTRWDYYILNEPGFVKIMQELVSENPSITPLEGARATFSDQMSETITGEVLMPLSSTMVIINT